MLYMIICILLGDHQQLRPAVASHQLLLEEQHDLSLLERLVTCADLPFTLLTTQHRYSTVPLASWSPNQL